MPVAATTSGTFLGCGGGRKRKLLSKDFTVDDPWLAASPSPPTVLVIIHFNGEGHVETPNLTRVTRDR